LQNIIAQTIQIIGLEQLYNPDCSFLTHPEIIPQFAATATTLGARLALRDALVRGQASALRSSGASEECVFALCGVEYPVGIGVDDREIGIACLSRPRAAAFGRLLEIGKGRLETYEAFEKAGFNEEVARNELAPASET
jgi:hypothetical protein